MWNIIIAQRNNRLTEVIPKNSWKFLHKIYSWIWFITTLFIAGISLTRTLPRQKRKIFANKSVYEITEWDITRKATRESSLTTSIGCRLLAVHHTAGSTFSCIPSATGSIFPGIPSSIAWEEVFSGDKARNLDKTPKCRKTRKMMRLAMGI